MDESRVRRNSAPRSTSSDRTTSGTSIKPKASASATKTKSSNNSIIKGRKVDMNLVLDNALEISSLPLDEGKVNLDNYDEVRIRIDQYLKTIKKYGMQPTIVGLASAMGLTKATLYNIHQGTRTVRDPRVKSLIDQLYNVTLMVLEDGMQAGIIKEVTGIFLLKNNYGYKDTQEYVIQGSNLLGDAKSDAEMLEQYRASVPMLEELDED